MDDNVVRGQDARSRTENSISASERVVNPLEQAIIEMIRQRKSSSFCPLEVVRWIYPADWRCFMADVCETMMEMYRSEKILVTQKGIAVDPNFLPIGPVRITSNKSNEDGITKNDD